MSKKILVTGGSGMVGKSLKKILPNATYLSSKDCNLTNELDVSSLMTRNSMRCCCSAMVSLVPR